MCVFNFKYYLNALHAYKIKFKYCKLRVHSCAFLLETLKAELTFGLTLN